jgi:DNA adenine methylase
MYTRGLDGEKLLKPPIKLIGAKTKVRDRLYPLFPEHEHYVEPFGGTFGVLIGKPKSKTEWINDGNPYVPAFYRTILSDPEKFWELLQIELDCLYARPDGHLAEFTRWKRQLTKTSDQIQKSVLFYLITKHALNGILRFNKSGECNSTFCKTVKGRGILTPEWLEAVRMRLAKVTLTNDDVFAMGMGGREPIWDTAFIFLDPPYRYKTIENGKGCVTIYNGSIFTDTQHKQLFDIVDGANFKWLLTINDDPWIRELYKDYHIVPHSIFYSCSQTSAGRSERPELLIANYDIESKFEEVKKKLESKSRTTRRVANKPRRNTSSRSLSEEKET